MFFFQWNTGLDAKYSGLILRFDLTCAGRTRGYTRSQCLLVKSKGNYTLSGIYVCLLEKLLKNYLW